MPQQFTPPTPTDKSPFDPISFSDEIIFGLDPAVHWLVFKGPGKYFPLVAIAIANHWKNREWLVKLLERHGYNDKVYDPNTNPQGIFSRPFYDRRWNAFQSVGLPAIRTFLLRAAGANTLDLQYEFGQPFAPPVMNLAREPLQEITTKRKQLTASLKKSS